MKKVVEGDRVSFRFSTLKKLVIDKEKGSIEYWDGNIPFSSVRGYWKNYHPKGKKMVYYVMLLTSQKLHKITPELGNEGLVDEILDILQKYVPVEVKK